jgi:choice-of-anchor C domain-containing protein
MKKILTLGIALIMLLACVGAVSAANIVTNGGFETVVPAFSGTFETLSPGDTNIAPWSIDAGSIDLINTYWQNNAGSPYSVDLSGNAPGTISQILDTKDGQTCTLSFYMSGNPDNPGTKSVNVLLGSNPVSGSPFTFSTANSRSNMMWEQKTASGLAATGPTTISFVADPNSGAYGPALDDISVECTGGNTPVPEFPSVALPAAFIVGLIGAVLFIQKSKEE